MNDGSVLIPVVLFIIVIVAMSVVRTRCPNCGVLFRNKEIRRRTISHASWFMRQKLRVTYE